MALVALLEDPRLVPKTHMDQLTMTVTPALGYLTSSSNLYRHLHSYPHTHTIKQKSVKFTLKYKTKYNVILFEQLLR